MNWIGDFPLMISKKNSTRIDLVFCDQELNKSSVSLNYLQFKEYVRYSLINKSYPTLLQGNNDHKISES